MYTLLIIVLYSTGLSTSWKIDDYPSQAACDTAGGEQVAAVKYDLSLFHDLCEVGSAAHPCRPFKFNFDPHGIASIQHLCIAKKD
jgi:hypothetical protein